MTISIVCYLTQRIGSKFQVAQIWLYNELLNNVFNMAFWVCSTTYRYLSLCKMHQSLCSATYVRTKTSFFLSLTKIR